MEAVEFQALVERISGLTAGQRAALIEAVRAKASASDAVRLIDRRFAAAPRCPHCKSVAVGTWSRPRPLTRYKCRDCRRTFTGLTGTPLERLRRRDAWLDYAQALAGDGGRLFLLRQMQEPVPPAQGGVERDAATLGRLAQAHAVGIVEVDETYFLRSQKGARRIAGRKARKRGGKASRPGLSDEHAPVLIARDRTGATTDAVLDKVDTASITRHLGGVVQKDTLLISDGEKAYGAFAAALGLLHVWIVVSKGEHVWRGYHIQNVNAYTSRLKTWMIRFRGVATKYLDSYLGWRRRIDRDGDGLPADRWLIAAVA